MTYDVDYFINKFEAIPEDRWTTRDLVDSQGRCCALGHCGIRESVHMNEEADALNSIIRTTFADVTAVNDSDAYGDDGPKNRILRALRTIKQSASGL